MSLIVTQRPKITSPGDSFWNGVSNPILYKFQREDYQSNTLTNSGGNLRIVLTGDLTSVIAVGASVYYRSDNAVYDGYYTVLTISYSAPDTTITFTGGYVSAGTTGFINLTTRLNYRAEIEVYTSALVGTIRVSPDSRGVVIADISKVLWSELSPDIGFDLTLGNSSYTDSNAYTSFYIKYRSIYIGTTGSQTDDVANIHYAVYGGRQIPSTYGGNYYEYCKKQVNGVVQFLTKLDFYRMWRGWPAPVSIIVNEYTTTNVYLSIPGGGTSSLNAYPGRVIVYDLNEVAVTQTDNQLIFTHILDFDTSDLSEDKRVNLSDVCDNPIMLMCRNSLGGILFWVFQVNQEYTYVYEDGAKRKRALLFAENLTLNEWEALHDFITLGEIYRNNIVEFTSSVIKTSSRIGNQVYSVDSTGETTGVIVIPTTNTTNTKQEKHIFTLEIEYPEIFTT